MGISTPTIAPSILSMNEEGASQTRHGIGRRP